MEVTVNLISIFSKYMEGRIGNKIQVEDGATVGSLAKELGLPEKYVRIVTVNGKQVGLDNPLSDGDVIFFFPPAIGGG
jgi:molybdopterin converting factor small subunit